MAKNTTQILLITGGVALTGIVLYMVFAPSNKASTISYTSGTVKTNPSTSSNNALTNAEVQVGSTLANKLIDSFFTSSTPSTDQTQTA